MALKLFMLIAVPGTGKSTFLKNFLKDKEAFVFSTDDFIDERAKKFGKTYDELFKDTISEAENEMFKRLTEALRNKKDIVIDRTNLNRKSRAKILSRIPKEYKKTALFFKPPVSDSERAEWKRRLDSRPGKTIPAHILDNMLGSIQKPELDEGFDEILNYNLW